MGQKLNWKTSAQHQTERRQQRQPDIRFQASRSHSTPTSSGKMQTKSLPETDICTWHRILRSLSATRDNTTFHHGVSAQWCGHRSKDDVHRSTTTIRSPHDTQRHKDLGRDPPSRTSASIIAERGLVKRLAAGRDTQSSQPHNLHHETLDARYWPTGVKTGQQISVGQKVTKIAK